jgi:hypothetical protein
LYYYGARWYDASLGRFLSADTIVPNPGDPQAWDRYAAMNNNPVVFVDPSGHMAAQGTGGGGLNLLKTCRIRDLETPPNQINTNTNAILLKGGAGSGSYDAAAENSYTGFSTSGASPTTGWADIPDLGNFVAAWVRDNTNVRDLWSIPEVQGQVFSQVTDNGALTVTGASITNNSFEDVGISFIYAETHSQFGDVKISGQTLYPYNHQSIVTPDFGIAHPGTSSGVVPFTSSPIYSGQYMNVTIRVRTLSERYGDIGVQILFNP